RTFFHSTIGHRAIGVVYDPEIEQYGNYVPSRLSKRYDAFIYVEKTHALSPLIF
ncbi:erythromycin esterase family protein, partial [Priestia megaterium]